MKQKRSFEEEKKKSTDNSQLSSRSQGSFIGNMVQGVKNKLLGQPEKVERAYLE